MHLLMEIIVVSRRVGVFRRMDGLGTITFFGMIPTNSYIVSTTSYETKYDFLKFLSVPFYFPKFS